MSEVRLHDFFEVLQAELQSCQPSKEPIKFSVKRQLERARKRARFVRSHLEAEAVARFIQTNDSVRDKRIDLPQEVVAAAKHFITAVLERWHSNLSEEHVQTCLDLDEIFNRWRFGPGASNGVKGTHTAEKIYQPMTCTAQCESLVVSLRKKNPYFSRFDCDKGVSGTTVVQGSRLATVPKNEDTVRTIAIEPSGNMVLQLAAGSVLEDVLRMIGLDIRKQQPKNKEAALRGSVTGRLATIDLKSASDMISLALVRLLFPREWIWFLESIRSREIKLPSGEWIPMHMISTMGNGFTFPLMTLIIVSLIYGYRRNAGGPNLFIDWSDTCVYGDDIIIPVHEYEDICGILEGAGLVVNHDKSYSEGPFRESCGGDYYEGVDVTPFYITSLDNPSEIYSAINKILDWCDRNSIWLHQTLGFLRGLLKGKAFLVPEWENPDSGILTQQVPRRYSKLQPVSRRIKLREPEPFAMMLAVGGYVEAVGSDLCYIPRSNKPRYVVRHSRLPRGYLDGWDPRKRTRRSSDMISTYVEIMFA